MQHTVKRSIASMVAAFGSLIGNTAARAQNAGFGTGQVSVLKASNFIDDYQSGEYSYGSPLTMTVRVEALKRWAGERIQARVFVLDASGPAVPETWRRVADCDVFYTFVIPINRVAASGRLNLGGVNSLGWMRMPDGGLAKGRFLVVFESAKDNNPVFRLHRADRNGYFARGIVITATHASARASATSSVRWLESDRLRRKREMAQISLDRTCYRFQIADGADASIGPLARLDRCRRDRSAVDDRRGNG